MSDADEERQYDRMIVYLRNTNQNYGVLSFMVRTSFPARSTRVLYLLHKLGMR